MGTLKIKVTIATDGIDGAVFFDADICGRLLDAYVNHKNGDDVIGAKAEFIAMELTAYFDSALAKLYNKEF